MCIPDKPGLLHKCFDDCPLCWIFETARFERLSNGESVTLGVMSHIVYMAKQGCRLCIFYVQNVVQGSNGDILMTATVSATFGVNSFVQLKLKVQNPFDALYAPKTAAYSVTEIASYELSLGIYAKDGVAAESWDQKAADANVVSDEVNETVKCWLQECSDVHEGCPEVTATELPTRVIDLSTFAADRKVKLFESNGKKDFYAALSYCWGKTRQLLTLQSNLEQHKEGIDMQLLPKTLQDAMTSAWNFGLDYIWIDSLCIIQNNNEDKDRELPKMAQIYKNATITISAASAPDCGDGFLENKQDVQERLDASFKLPFFSNSSEDSAFTQDELMKRAGDIFLCPDPYLGFQIKDFTEEVINTRAWTLQESWLAPRLLMFGSGPLKWRCLSHTYTYGTDSQSIPDIFSDSLFRKRAKFFDVRNDTENEEDGRQRSLAIRNPAWHQYGVTCEWEEMIFQFSCRDLTVRTDKLPALSGVAAEFQRVSGNHYLAGLWREHLPWALLWYSIYKDRKPAKEGVASSSSVVSRLAGKLKGLSVGRRSGANSKMPDMPLATSDDDYICPSWSFAHTNEKVGFKIPIPSDRVTHVTVDEAHTVLANSRVEFGRVVSGALTVTGPIRRLEYDDVTEFFVIVTEGTPHIYWDYIIPDDGARNKIFKNAVKIGRAGRIELNEQLFAGNRLTSSLFAGADPKPRSRSKPPQGSITELKSQSNSGNCFWFLEIQSDDTPAGLMLSDVGDGTFRRVGFFKMGRNTIINDEVGGHDLGRRRFDWDDGLHICTLTIV